MTEFVHMNACMSDFVHMNVCMCVWVLRMCVFGLKEHGPVYLAVSLLWPGEQVTLMDEGFYD